MKKQIFILTYLFVFFVCASAQPNAERRDERIKSFRIAIFTEQLALTSEEAQVFWPIYNEYINKRDALQEQSKPSKRLEDMQEAELEAQITKHFDRQQRELELEREMVAKLRKVLPLRKIVKIPHAEREFREAIFKKVQERRAERSPKNR